MRIFVECASGKRWFLVLLGVAALASYGFVSSALATIGWTWGYNNLSASNPPAGTCPGSVAGLACSGWANWDYSQVDWTSGSGYFAFGFICQSDGLLHGISYGDGATKTTYTEVYTHWCPGHYNKVAVSHVSGTYDYLQSRALIF